MAQPTQNYFFDSIAVAFQCIFIFSLKLEIIIDIFRNEPRVRRLFNVVEQMNIVFMFFLCRVSERRIKNSADSF